MVICRAEVSPGGPNNVRVRRQADKRFKRGIRPGALRTFPIRFFMPILLSLRDPDVVRATQTNG